MSETVGYCAVCKVKAKQFCSACKSVVYCGADHQRAHWKQHKKECRPFKIAHSEELGRYLLVTRDIKAKQVVFTENPLVVGPQWFADKKKEKSQLVPCIGCCIPCRLDRLQCQKCKWPVCSPNCAGLADPKLHADVCTVLKYGPGPSGKSVEARMDYYRCDALFALKCLLLQATNSKKWKELLDMESHEEERFETELYYEVQERIVDYLQKNYLKKLNEAESKKKEKLLPECGEDIIHKICGIIETNYMCITLMNGVELSGLFYTACMMENTCQPNCYFQFDNKNGFKISVVAGRDIRKDEHLHIMYSNMLWGTQMRHEHLKITKHFVCKCERCRDPSEFGTFLSGMICVGDVDKECGGTQLPLDPLSPETDWFCEKCPVVVNSSDIRFLLVNITEDINRIMEKPPTIHQLEEMIAMLLHLLHPNHYHIFTLKHSLVQLYGNEEGYLWPELSDEQLRKKMQMCEEMLAICDKLDPYTIKLSIYVGILLVEMQKVSKEEGRRLIESTPKRPAEALEQFRVARNYLDRAAKVLEKEADTLTGSKMNDSVQSAGFELDFLIAYAKN